jgi:hypothetical protein
MIYIDVQRKVYFIFDKNKITFSPHIAPYIFILYPNCLILKKIKYIRNKDIFLEWK